MFENLLFVNLVYVMPNPCLHYHLTSFLSIFDSKPLVLVALAYYMVTFDYKPQKPLSQVQNHWMMDRKKFCYQLHGG